MSLIVLFCSCVAQPAATVAIPSSSSQTVVQDSARYRCQIFSYRELAIATNSFREESLIGRGGFGAVYKGRLNNGKVIYNLWTNQFNNLWGVSCPCEISELCLSLCFVVVLNSRT